MTLSIKKMLLLLFIMVSSIQVSNLSAFFFTTSDATPIQSTAQLHARLEQLKKVNAGNKQEMRKLREKLKKSEDEHKTMSPEEESFARALAAQQLHFMGTIFIMVGYFLQGLSRKV